MDVSPMIAFLAHFLIVLAAWTVTIKFLFPIAYAAAYGLPIGTHIYWDFWWVVHLWLAWALLRWRSFTWPLALGVSSIEIVIVLTKFALFLAAPEWTVWTTNWFINKLFVLLVFCLMLPYFVLRRRELRDRRDERGRPISPPRRAARPAHTARTPSASDRRS